MSVCHAKALVLGERSRSPGYNTDPAVRHVCNLPDVALHDLEYAGKSFKGRVVGNEILGRVVDQVKERVTQGDSIADPLKQSHQFPPIVTHMVSVGEASGTLEDMLFNVADTYDDEVETAVAGLTSIIEPVIIVVMGVIVGFIVMAILLPIFQMNQFRG